MQNFYVTQFVYICRLYKGSYHLHKEHMDMRFAPFMSHCRQYCMW